MASVQHSEGLPRSVRYEDLFRDLPAATRQAFERLEERSSYPQGATLFVEDQLGSGVFILREGSVRLAHSFAPGAAVSAVIALPGEILGVAATVSGEPYESAAQTIEPSQVGFVSRRSLMEFLREQNAVAFRLVQLLSDAMNSTLDRSRLLGLGADTKH